MKRTALALLIPAILTMGAANAAEIYNKDGNKVDLYGKVDARHTFSDNKGDDGDATYTQIGFRGETQINSALMGFGQWEYKMMANDTEDSGRKAWTRLAFAGLKFGDYGSLDYGRNYGVVYDIDAWTDMLPVFGGDTAAQTDNYMMGRASGVATYRNADFFGLVDGLNFAIQYQGANEGANDNEDQEGTNNGRSYKYSNGDGWGMSSSYDFNFGLSFGAAFSSSDRTNEQEALGRGDTIMAGGEKAEAWTVGTKYDANNIYLAAMYAETNNMTPFGAGYIANKTQNFEVVAQYQFDFGLRPSVAYLQSKGKELNSGYGNDKDLVKYVDVAATYYFNKNFSAYADYKINLLDGNDDFYNDAGISTDDVVGVGMIYQF